MTKVYVCGVSYQHEMDYPEIVGQYSSVEELKNSTRCWKECGIVEISLDESGNEVSHVWIAPQDLFWGKK